MGCRVRRRDAPIRWRSHESLLSLLLMGDDGQASCFISTAMYTAPVTGAASGNFLQTFSMAGIINGVTKLSKPWEAFV